MTTGHVRSTRVGGRRDRRTRVLFVQHSNPAAYPPVEHGALLLADAGCRVRLIGVALLEAARLADHPRVSLQLRRPARPGWRQRIDHLGFIAWCLAQAWAFRPDWIYASDPLAAPATWMMGVLLRVPVVYHEHDAPEPARARSVVARVVGWCRRAVARRAVMCVAPGDGRAELLRRDTGCSAPVVVWNTPLRREAAASAARADGPLRLLYHGSIVPARVPEALLHAVAASSSRVILRIAGYDPAGGEYLNRLRTLSVELGIDGRVEFPGTVPTRAELLREAAQCDVGLALLPIDSSSINERTMVGASNKPFDYMACGLALLVADLPEWHETFVAQGFGRACDPASVASIVSAIAWFESSVAERRAMGERGRRRVLDRWHYEREFAPVLTVIAGSDAETPASPGAGAGSASTPGTGHADVRPSVA